MSLDTMTSCRALAGNSADSETNARKPQRGMLLAILTSHDRGDAA